MILQYIDISVVFKAVLFQDLKCVNVAGKWINSHCDYGKGFICKRNNEHEPPKTVAPTTTVGGFCPEGYFGIGKYNSQKTIRVDFVMCVTIPLQ